MKAAWVFLVALLAGCASAPASQVVPHFPNPFATAPALHFLPAVELPDSSKASEPSLAIGPDDVLYVSAPQGLPSASPLWQSLDHGASWQVLQPNSAQAGSVGLGGGDTSIAVGRDGSVYVTDLWAGSATVSSSHDEGKTWFTSPVSSEVPYYDRQWNAVDATGAAYFLGRTLTPGQAAWVSRSTDGGKTWLADGNPWTSTDASTEWQDGPLVTNPKTDALGVAYTCGDGSSVCFAQSADAGLTWASVTAAKADGPAGNDFPALAADAAGNWYLAYSEATKDGSRVFLAHSADGASWSAPVAASPASGNAVFPWIVAGDAGRVAIAWYGTSTPGDANDATAMKSASWDVEVAQSLDALEAAPRFVTVPAASGVHVGTVDTQGLDPTNPQAPDRSLGDFFTIAADQEGRVHVAFVRSVDGHAALEWTRQDGGDLLYASGHAPTLPTPSGNATLPLPPTIP
jgi:hypothetical protein